MCSPVNTSSTPLSLPNLPNHTCFCDLQDSSKDETTQQDAAAASSSMSTLDILEARVKSSKRRGRVEPKVAVNSPIVDQTTGKVPATPEAQTETAFVSALLFLFVAILIEGLALAGAGFLPEEIDAFIQDAIYPSFSPTVLAFLGASSLYGLWKTGKLPGQQQTLDK